MKNIEQRFEKSETILPTHIQNQASIIIMIHMMMAMTMYILIRIMMMTDIIMIVIMRQA